MTVYQVQCLLAYLGYYSALIDGIPGPRTTAGIRNFQGDNGLDTDGVAGKLTQGALTAAVAEGKLRPASAEPEPETEAPQEEADWWREIRHFTRSEFACKCGGRYCGGYPAEMQEAAVRIADDAREHFGRPGHVISGLRCRMWNQHEGGVSNSQHMAGEAIDLRIDGVSAEELRQFVSKHPNHRYSYCITSSNVHFDIPPTGK